MTETQLITETSTAAAVATGIGLSLVIPARNEAECIASVVTNARDALAILSPNSWEIVLVDDASTDDTVRIAREALGADAPHLFAIRREVSQGYGAAVGNGLMEAHGNLIAFVDGDGQFDVHDLGKLLARIGDHDMVTGFRIHRADPWYRSVISGVFNVLVRVVYGLRVRDLDCGLKVMRRPLLDAMRPLQACSALLNTEMYWKARRCRAKVVQVGVPHHPRLAGKRSGGRLIPIMRACRDLLRMRVRLARTWRAPKFTSVVDE